MTKVEMLEVLETKIKQFAKRQLTWLKRDTSIEWYPPENREAIFGRVDDFLRNQKS
jgi:tRNA A37 N6-isopentenylltransferase MiaA